jgi:hypothetical protein
MQVAWLCVPCVLVAACAPTSFQQAQDICFGEQPLTLPQRCLGIGYSNKSTGAVYLHLLQNCIPTAQACIGVPLCSMLHGRGSYTKVYAYPLLATPCQLRTPCVLFSMCSCSSGISLSLQAHA